MTSFADAPLLRLEHAAPSGTTVAVVAPLWGANVLGFSYHPSDLRWPVPFLEPVDLASVAATPTSYGIPILAPTPGRVGRERGGVFRYRGAEYRLPYEQHGFLRHLPWAVTDRSDSALTCALEIRPDEALGSFPFAFSCGQQVTVSERRLDLTMSFRSTSPRVQPISLGWHAYLHRPPRCRVRIPASRVWQLDGRENPTPTGVLLDVGTGDDFRTGRLVGPDDHWDETLTDLADEGGTTRCWVEDEPLLVGRDDQPLAARVWRTIEISTVDGSTAAFRHVQLYTPPGRPAIAVEPFSSPPNALNLLADGHPHTDVRELPPGGALSFHMALSLSVERR